MSTTREVKSNEPRLNGYTLRSCLFACIGPLLYGMDVGVTGGVLAMPSFLEQFFPEVYKAKLDHFNNTSDSSYCLFRSGLLSLFACTFLLAAMTSSLIGSWSTSKLGRLASMRIGSSCFLLGAIINVTSVHLSMLFIGRILVGLGGGFNNQSVPVYLSELSPPATRGAILSCFQIAMCLGIVLGGVFDYFTSDIEFGWRISFGTAIPPAVCLLLGSCFLPETPAFLHSVGNIEEARTTMQKLRGVNANVEHELEKIEYDSNEAKKFGNQWQQLRVLMTRPYRGELTIAASVSAFSRLTGVNAILYFVPQLITSLGEGNAVFTKVIIVFSVFLLGSLASIFIIDRVGRKLILITGAITSFVTKVSLAIVLRYTFDPYNSVATSQAALDSYLVLICCFTFIFGISWSPLGWFFPVECQSQATRSAGACVSVVSNFSFIFLTAELFLPLLCSIGWGTFLVFGCLDLIIVPFICLFYVETKGISIADVRKEFQNHWYWKKFAGQTDGQTNCILKE